MTPPPPPPPPKSLEQDLEQQPHHPQEQQEQVGRVVAAAAGTATTTTNTSTTFLTAFLDDEDDIPMYTRVPSLQEPVQEEEQQEHLVGEEDEEKDKDQQQQPPELEAPPPRFPLGSFTTSLNTTSVVPSGTQHQEEGQGGTVLEEKEAAADSLRQRKRDIEAAVEQVGDGGREEGEDIINEETIPPSFSRQTTSQTMYSTRRHGSTRRSTNDGGRGEDIVDEETTTPPSFARQTTSQTMYSARRHGSTRRGSTHTHGGRRRSSTYGGRRRSSTRRQSTSRRRQSQFRPQRSGRMSRRISTRPSLLVHQPSVKESMLSAIHQSVGITANHRRSVLMASTGQYGGSSSNTFHSPNRHQSIRSSTTTTTSPPQQEELTTTGQFGSPSRTNSLMTTGTSYTSNNHNNHSSRRMLRGRKLSSEPTESQKVLSTIQNSGIQRIPSKIGGGASGAASSPQQQQQPKTFNESMKSSIKQSIVRVPSSSTTATAAAGQEGINNSNRTSSVVKFQQSMTEDEDDFSDLRFGGDDGMVDYDMSQEEELRLEEEELQEEMKHTEHLIERLKVLKYFFAFFFGFINGTTYSLSKRYATIMTGNVLVLAQNVIDTDWDEAIFTICLILSYQLGASFFFVVWYDDNTAKYLGLSHIRRFSAKIQKWCYHQWFDPHRHYKKQKKLRHLQRQQQIISKESGQRHLKSFLSITPTTTTNKNDQFGNVSGGGPIDLDDIYEDMEKEMKYYDADDPNFDATSNDDGSFQKDDDDDDIVLAKGSQTEKGTTTTDTADTTPTKVVMPSSSSDENSSSSSSTSSSEEELNAEEREEMEKEFDEEWVDVIFVIAFILSMGLLSDYLKLRTGCRDTVTKDAMGDNKDDDCEVEGFYYLCPLAAISGVIAGGYLSVHPTGVITNMITGHLGKVAQNGVKITLPSIPSSEKEAEAFGLSFGICLSFFIGAVGGFAIPVHPRSFELFTAQITTWAFMMSLLIFVFHSTFNAIANGS